MKKPMVMTLEGWDSWRKEYRESQPVRYFFCETVPTFFRRMHRRLRDAAWWVRHRIDPRHRYHIVRTGLPAGYYDSDDLVLHACFNLLKRFVEIQKPFEHFDTEHSSHKDVWIEVKALYEWWTKARPARIEPLDGCEHMTPEDRRAAAIASHKADDANYLEDQSHLHRLIDVRGHLWT